MKYNVHQHWDPLKVCIVGKSYSPEFYSFIKNARVRTVMERIAYETEEDYQRLIKLLESFGVSILRPYVSNDYKNYLDSNGRISIPPMTPRDYSAMVGNDFYIDVSQLTQKQWKILRGEDWPIEKPDDLTTLPQWIKDELTQQFEFPLDYKENKEYREIFKQISPHCNLVFNKEINSAMTTRIGKDLYFGTESYDQDQKVLLEQYRLQFPDYRCHIVNSGGHADGTYCPVVPGLIISLYDIPTYADTFPDWEVVYLPGQSWNAVKPFLNLKEKNQGKWWVPGEELNEEFTDFVESWLGHWVGYVEESVFDVNMLIIDEKNVVCNNYNEEVFKAFDRFGITPHVINFRHRYFWDGGLHCITSDVHREGTLKDYFPERG
jgi:hypothetical protein